MPFCWFCHASVHMEFGFFCFFPFNDIKKNKNKEAFAKENDEPLLKQITLISPNFVLGTHFFVVKLFCRLPLNPWTWCITVYIEMRNIFLSVQEHLINTHCIGLEYCIFHVAIRNELRISQFRKYNTYEDWNIKPVFGSISVLRPFSTF